MSDASWVTPQAAFLSSMEILRPHWKKVMGKQELRYRMEVQNGLYIIKVFDPVWLSERRVGVWTLKQLPGCCGVLVSTEASVVPAFQRMGFGTLFNQMRLFQARAQGYGKIICTVISTNVFEIKILQKNGWAIEDTFINPKTQHTILTFAYKLNLIGGNSA